MKRLFINEAPWDKTKQNKTQLVQPWQRPLCVESQIMLKTRDFIKPMKGLVGKGWDREKGKPSTRKALAGETHRCTHRRVRKKGDNHVTDRFGKTPLGELMKPAIVFLWCRNDPRCCRCQMHTKRLNNYSRLV